MNQLQRRLAGSRAAGRVLRAGNAPRPRRFPVLVRRPGVRRAVVALSIVGALAVHQALPRAFVGMDPAGWAVVAQMAALVSEMISIKRQVENQRDQARAHIYGKIAPLAGKVSVGHQVLSNYLDVNEAPWFDGTNPIVPEEPFNTPPPLCTGNNPPADCLPDPDDLVLDAGAQADARQTTNTILSAAFGGAVPTHVSGSVGRLFDAVEYLTERTRDDRDAADARAAERRATVAMAMGIVEEWRGCNRSTEANPYTLGTVQRPPCFTAGGEGRGQTLSDGEVGTEGVLEGLYEALDFVQANQEGDASLTQLATIETQVNLMRARIQAANLELDLFEAEQEQRNQFAREAAVRRNDEFLALQIECLQGNGGGSVFNMLEYDPENPSLSTCVQVENVVQQHIDLMDDIAPLHELIQ